MLDSLDLLYGNLFQPQSGDPFIPYTVAQQKLRYEIVKNRSRNTQKRLYFDLKIANFLQRLGFRPQTPIWELGVLPPDFGYPNFSNLDPFF